MLAPTRKPKLGTYTNIKQRLIEQFDPHKVYLDIDGVEHTGFTFVDLFCGAGGMSKGFYDAGFKPISSVEINETASLTHNRNFPMCKHFNGDISDYDSKKYTGENSIDVVIGGPPCNGFSVAGKRDPNDPRNKLFYEFVKVVDELKPKYFVMENVPGIITIKKGKVIERIFECFKEIGYQNISMAILEAADYGIAQFRSRAIIIGNNCGLHNPYPAPKFTIEQYVPIEDAIRDLPANKTIPEINHEWTKHSKKFIERISKIKQGESMYETYRDAYKRQYTGIPSMTIKENHGGSHIHPSLNRCISAREMARLQSFPDDFIFEGSMKKAMWQIGNAVPPLLAKCIGMSLIPLLEEAHGFSKRTKHKISQLNGNGGQLQLF
jgi:DNA (cytosine-5)-methyltransferase 1